MKQSLWVSVRTEKKFEASQTSMLEKKARQSHCHFQVNDEAKLFCYCYKWGRMSRLFKFPYSLGFVQGEISL